MKIKSAVPSLTPKNLSYSHYTTLGFGQVIPVGCYEVCPKSNFTIRPSVFARTDPQKLPNLGSIKLNMHAFYVPFHLVWNHFENFVVGRKSWISSGATIYRNVPFTTNYYLTKLFTTSSYGLATTCAYSVSDFGWYDEDTPANTAYYHFTKKGKCAYHILSALGYKFTFVPTNEATFADSDSLGPQQFSLLPLMCFFKAFMDRYIPSYLQMSSPINQFFEYIRNITGGSLAQPIDDSRIAYMFDFVFNYYEQNYFTAAWTSPNSPLDGVVADFYPVRTNSTELQNLSSSTDSSYATEPQGTNTKVATSVPLGNGVIALNSTQITLVQKFNNLIRRLNYSGSKVGEALKSLFGVSAPALEINTTQFLGSASTELQKTDVTSTGSTDELGSMAGKSWFAAGNDVTFKCNCDYYGMIFVFASIDTPSNFVRGLRRNLTHIKPLSFYQPDFDGTLLQAIRGSELFSQNFYLNKRIVQDLVSRGLEHEDVYGFVPRYCEYSTQLDNVSGDFDIGTLSASINPYILPREVVDIDDIRAGFANGDGDQTDFESAMYGLGASGEVITPIDAVNANDSVQFNRIFKDTLGIADPFFCVFHFDTLANTPTLPLDDVAEIRGRGKELQFSENGKYLI